MGLSDPFSTTYQGSMQAGMSLGQGLDSAAGSMDEAIKRKQAFNMLKQVGMVNETTTDPSIDQLTQGLKDYGKQQGKDVNINYGDNPDEAKKNIVGIYKALNIPMPQGKTTTTLNLTPGTQFNPMKGEVSFAGPQMNPTTAMMAMMGMNASGQQGQAQSQTAQPQTTQPTPTAQPQDGTAAPTAPAQTYQGGIQGVLSSPSPKSPEEKDAAIAALPPMVGNNIRLMLEDKQNAKDITGMGNAAMRQVYTSLAQHIDPSYDPTQVPARMATRKDFSPGGQTGKNLASINTVIHHADTAYDQFQALDNTGIKKANGIGNYLKSQVGDPRVDTLNTTLSFIDREAPKAIAGGIISDKDKADFENNLNAAQTKEVASKVLDNFIGLMAGRTQPKVEQWQQVFGNDKTFPVIGPSAVAILKKHGFNYDPQTGSLNKADAGQAQGNSGSQTFNVGGKSYNIPSDQVDAFKKDMGL